MTQPICFGPFEKLNPRDDFSLRQSDHVKESVTDSLTIQGISRKATAGRERLSRTCCSCPHGVSSKVVTNENRSSIATSPKLEKLIDIVRTLPDPPDGSRVSEVVGAIDQLRAEVARVADTNSHHAAQLAQYIGYKLQVSPKVILQTAKSTTA